jgi:formylglycine-generating enzyme required for sulfatase activity
VNNPYFNITASVCRDYRLDEDRQFLLWRKRLRDAREEWLRLNKDPGALLYGERLKEAKRWLKARGRGDFTDEERDYVRRSMRRDRRRRAFAASLAVPLLFVAGFIWWTDRENTTMRIGALVLLTRAGLIDPPPEPQMERIKAGRFSMGSPKSDPEADPSEFDQHLVSIQRPFLIGRYEVTFKEYDEFVRITGKRSPDDSGWGRDNRPVINVSWEDAVAYAKWLSMMTGKRYRLPTEAEWEYAARAGTETAYWWDNKVGQNHANCTGCGSQWDSKQTVPVGSFKPNPWRLHDTAGNVYEWVQDCWHKNYAGAPEDGSKVWETEGSGDCALRVIRGGSWGGRPGDVRSAFRGGLVPVYRNYLLGFRLAQDE